MDSKESIGVLNDLLRINHDRINGYEKAIAELKDEDSDLKSIFNRMVSESRNYSQELESHVRRLGGDPAEGTTASGKVYRVWMDMKATFTGKDRKAILSSCEFGEDAAQKAYDMALSGDGELASDLRQVITSQKSSLRASHDEIKNLRDSQS